MKISKQSVLVGAVSLIVGATIILGIRFFAYKPDTVHYHANFAVFINGQQEQFKGMGYYTDVNACVTDDTVYPSQRAHMHDNVNNVVHVEAHAVTWGHFFNNIGWSLGPTFIATRDGTIYAGNGQTKLHFLLNGHDYTNLGGVTNNVIEDQDKLLISYGDISNAALQQQYATIPSTAQKYDVSQDPASCSGSHKTTTTSDRFKHLF